MTVETTESHEDTASSFHPLQPQIVAKATPTVFLSHWAKLIDKMQLSTVAFYTKLEAALDERKIPGLTRLRVEWKEGGPLSANREYFRLSRERLVFDICGAQFGNGFFVSWWFGENRSFSMWKLILAGLLSTALFILLVYAVGLCFAIGIVLAGGAIGIIACRVAIAQSIVDIDTTLLAIPVIGPIYERFFRAVTYYRIDRMLMYQEAVHAAVMQVIDEMTQAQGIAPLSELERRPVLAGLLTGQ